MIPNGASPEPVDDPFFAGLFDQFRAIAADCRVVLSGEGRDNLMHFQMWPYVQDMMRNREWERLLVETPVTLWLRPSLLPGMWRRAKGLFGKDRNYSGISALAGARLCAAIESARTRERMDRASCRFAAHPVLPKAHASLSLPHWSPHVRTRKCWRDALPR